MLPLQQYILAIPSASCSVDIDPSPAITRSLLTCHIFPPCQRQRAEGPWLPGWAIQTWQPIRRSRNMVEGVWPPRHAEHEQLKGSVLASRNGYLEGTLPSDSLIWNIDGTERRQSCRLNKSELQSPRRNRVGNIDGLPVLYFLSCCRCGGRTR